VLLEAMAYTTHEITGKLPGFLPPSASLGSLPYRLDLPPSPKCQQQVRLRSRCHGNLRDLAGPVSSNACCHGRLALPDSVLHSNQEERRTG
jgi:hypothetical protein